MMRARRGYDRQGETVKVISAALIIGLFLFTLASWLESRGEGKEEVIGVMDEYTYVGL